MHFYQYPEWSQTIRTHYWPLRYARGFDLVRIRKQCRLIEKEKKRLHLAGMVNPRNEKAAQRFWEAYVQSLQKQLF